ncbi:MAG: DUF1549 and DUF1553 domain-containing protein [Gemmataceae bacterium]
MRPGRAVTACLAALAALGPQRPADGRAPRADGPSPAGQHWSYRPVVSPRPPGVRGSCRTPVDRFILAALEARGGRLNPEADRPALVRRVSFDLTGLPPTPAEIDAFVADHSPDAYERMVDRYLASPHHGERWGKFWLDAAGYADSNGYFSADSDRPLAWRYRDYVVRAVNADRPYDRFVSEQLAGDELVGFAPDRPVTPAMVDGLAATHFLRNAPDGTGESDGNPDEVRVDRFTVLEGNVQNLMNCLLGVTIQCARCHSHKFEPVSLVEYYSLQAIFFPVYNPDRWVKPNDRVVTLGSPAERAAWQRRTDLVDRQVKALRDGLAAFADPLREQVIDERLKDLDTPTRDKVLRAHRAPAKKRTAEQQALLKAHAKAVGVSDEELAKRFPEYAALRERVGQALAEREKDRPRPLDRLAAFVETDAKPPTHHALRRGQHNQPGDEVRPGVPAAFSTKGNTFHVETPAPGRTSSGRRTAFAHWVTSPENPLFARVMVNRIWQHHFGTGLVTTPDNFGRSGAKPSHPELVDYLSAEFARSGWSVKAMHRLVLRSAVYRQTSTPREDLERIDPENRLLGRFPLRRLDAESLRDAMLHASGELDARPGGPYVPSRRTEEGTVEVAENVEGARRRSLYVQQRRTQVVTLLQVFDAPALVGTCGKRSVSTVPLQPLALLNSEFVRARARALARRLAGEAGPAVGGRLALAFRLTWARPPLGEELAACKEFLNNQRAQYAREKGGDDRAWADLCQMLLASNAFLYVE